MAELRHCLRAQVRDAKSFVNYYYRSLSVEVGQPSLETVEAFARIDDLLQELDQTIRDLLQLVSTLQAPPKLIITCNRNLHGCQSMKPISPRVLEQA